MKKTWILVLIILALSVLTHFIFFGRPNETVFDEVHFGKFVSGYLNRQYFFDIHPPLGKLMILGVAKISGFKTGFDFKEIGETYPDNSYIWLRLLPAIFGTLLAPIIFFLTRELRLSLLAAFASALLIIFENALLGQSLFILLDSMLLLFGFLGLLLYLIARRKQSILIFILAVIFLSFSLSIKWTGASFLGLVIIMEVAGIIRNLYLKSLRGATATKQSLNSKIATLPRQSGVARNDNRVLNFIILVFLPLIIYFSIFALHFSILNKSGTGDAFHSKEFQSTLMGNEYQKNPDIKKANIAEKFAELNLEMFRSNGRIDDKHPYASPWYSWPMMAKPIYYWNNDDTQNPSKIYLLGNPVIFWSSFMGLIILILNFIFFPEIRQKKLDTSLIIILGFLLNFLPFIFITRPMFLYHYLSALIFAVIALCFVIDLIKKSHTRRIIFFTLLLAALASFVFFAPLTYGLKMPLKSLNMRFLSRNWQ